MVYTILGILFPFLLLPVLFSQYSIIQSQHYEMKRYILYDIKRKFLSHLLLLCVFIVSLIVKEALIYLCCISIIILNVFFINKEKLKYTKRTIRFIAVYFIVSYAFLFSIQDYNLFLVISSFAIEYILLIHSISCMIERIIRNYYKKDAKKIIKGIKVIGITGSYGKTSCKNIIYDMLNISKNVSKTPKSYNTEIGIIKSIRENVCKFDEYFICEYGVDRVKGMDKLLKVVKPSISLITEIGNQHILTFKNINNIKDEKLKIARILKENEIAVLNNDNIYLAEEKNKLKCKVITYGIKNDSNIMAKEIEMTDKGSYFTLVIDGKEIKRVKTCLLGEHNIKNILGAIGVLKAMNISFYDIDSLVKYIKPVEHRLQLKTINGIRVIDDSFNSNEEGFKRAIDVLNLMNEYKIIITPGVVEQGDNSHFLNYSLGRYMADKIDEAILVNENADSLKKGLLDEGFSNDKIIIMKDFKEAWNYINNKKEEKIVLIENDLPSIYLK